MMVSKRNGIIWVPYGYLVSKFLKHVDFNVEDEESTNKFAAKEFATMKVMRIEINNGVPSQKPLRAIGAPNTHQAQ